MCEFETATDAPITYAELEVLIRLIIEDFTLLKAAEIKKELHNLSDDKVATIGLSVQDFIDYNTKINSLGKSAFTYLFHINCLLRKFVEKSIVNIVPSLGGLPILSDKYVSLNTPPSENEWMKITSYAEFLGLDYVREKNLVLIYISTLENHRKGWSREIPEPVFSIYLTILFPLLSKQKPKTYLYRLLLLPCC